MDDKTPALKLATLAELTSDLRPHYIPRPPAWINGLALGLLGLAAGLLVEATYVRATGEHSHFAPASFRWDCETCGLSFQRAVIGTINKAQAEAQAKKQSPAAMPQGKGIPVEDNAK